jgi:hypothetical protein
MIRGSWRRHDRYGALAAMQEPRVRAGVRASGRDLARRLAADPDAALDLPGGMRPPARANAALARRGEAWRRPGAGEKAAYSVQHQPWSRARLPTGRSGWRGEGGGRLPRRGRRPARLWPPWPRRAARRDQPGGVARVAWRR